MITPGTRITNARTGQVMRFLKMGAETNGALLRIECISPPSTVREPEHIHPMQENRFEILSGSCTFSVDGKERLAKAGEVVTVPPGTRHCFWNAGAEDAHYIQEFRPAGTIAEFFSTFFALANDGKLNEKGIPNFFHVSVIGLAHKNDIRLTSPPWALQYILYVLLAPIGKLMGFRASYSSKN